MDLEEVAVYRRNLQNYRYYNHSLIKHKYKLIELETIELGLHGMNTDGVVVQGSQDEYVISSRRFDLIDKIEKEKQEIFKFQRLIDEIEKDLSAMDSDISSAILNVYCLKKNTIYYEARRLYMDVSTLKRRINKEIWEVIKNKS